MQTAATLAFWFHSALFATFAGLACMSLAGRSFLRVTEHGPSHPDFAEGEVTAVFYAAGLLYLVYAEIYLFQMKSWSGL